MKMSSTGGNNNRHKNASLQVRLRTNLIFFVCVGSQAVSPGALAVTSNVKSSKSAVVATAEDVQNQYQQKNWSRFFGQLKWLQVSERWNQLPERIRDQLAALEVMSLIQHCQWSALQELTEQNTQPGRLLVRALSFVDFSKKPQAKPTNPGLNLIESRKQWQVKGTQALRVKNPSQLQFRVTNKCWKSNSVRSDISLSSPRSTAQVDTALTSSSEQSHPLTTQIEGEWVLTDQVIEPMGWNLGLGLGTSLGQTYTRTSSGLLQLTYSPWAVAGFGVAHRVFKNELSQFAQVFEREMDLQGLRVHTARVDSSQQLFAEVRPILGKFNLFGRRQVNTGLSLRVGLLRRNLSSGGQDLGTIAGAFFEIFGPRMSFAMGTLLESSNLSTPSNSNSVGDSAEWLIRLGIPLGGARR